MALIKDKGDEKFAYCPYCWPNSYELRYEESCHLISCVRCGFAVKINNMDYPNMKFESTTMVGEIPFHWESSMPQLKKLKGIPSMYYE